MSEKEKMTREQVLERLDAGERDFEGFDLSGLDLHGLDMHYINLHGANLTGINLQGADLRQASLREAILCGANLRGADLFGADLIGADVTGADLHCADFTDATGAKPVRQPDIEKGKAYANIKTGKVYTVLHSAAAAAWDIAQVLVVYQDTEQGAVWVRSLTEFKEKFTEARE
jgi:hypothetical protein